MSPGEPGHLECIDHRRLSDTRGAVTADRSERPADADQGQDIGHAKVDAGDTVPRQVAKGRVDQPRDTASRHNDYGLGSLAVIQHFGQPPCRLGPLRFTVAKPIFDDRPDVAGESR
jgi:hypothetical protein